MLLLGFQVLELICIALVALKGDFSTFRVVWCEMVQMSFGPEMIHINCPKRCIKTAFLKQENFGANRNSFC